MGEYWYGGWLEGVCLMEYLWERFVGKYMLSEDGMFKGKEV